MHYMLMRPHFTQALIMNNIKLWYMVLQIFIHLGKLLSYLNFNFYGFFNILIMKDLLPFILQQHLQNKLQLFTWIISLHKTTHATIVPNII
jgi:hypothetical protein